MIAFQNIKEATIILNDINHKEEIFKVITNIIYNAIDNSEKEVTIFFYNDEDLYHKVTREEYYFSLQKALDYYISIENYEDCIELDKYLKILNSEK